MTTYEHGKAPADAPVTWWPVVHSTATALVGGDGWSFDVHKRHADSICRTFHLAKLAEEAKAYMDRLAGHRDPFPANWLRRFRAAKGDA